LKLEITANMVKELRQATGAGVLECKKALSETHGDFDKAVALLRERGLAAASKKVGREAREGIIEAYVHAGSRLASLIELNCETDFVARTGEFKALAHDLAMQVVASQPRYLRPEDVPIEVIEAERARYRAEAESAGTLPHMVDQIVENKLNKFYEEICLLEQPFIKDGNIKVKDLLTQYIARLGENIIIRRFVRYELGA